VTLHGVAWKLTAGDWKFEVGFDSGNETGLDQLDVFASQRVSSAAIDLHRCSTGHLLAAYRGPDRDSLLADNDETLEVSSGLTKGQRARARKQARQAHARQLRAALLSRPHDAFDMAALADRYPVYAEARHVRTFYFDDARKEHINNFCAKYASDPEYRTQVDRRETPWAIRDDLFDRNLSARFEARFLGRSAPSSWSDDGRSLYHWLSARSEKIAALPDYARLRALDATFTPSVSELDPGIRDGVAAWTMMPEGVTRFSCQGISGLVRYENVDLVVEMQHHRHAYISFEVLPDDVRDLACALAPAYPSVWLGTWAGAPALISTGDNVQFRTQVVALARAVHDALTGKTCSA
jgi:hypothetical protein